MRKFLIGMIAGLALAVSLTQLYAQEYNLEAEKQQLNARQKEERKALKLKGKFKKESWKEQQIPKSVRLQAKHERQREERELRNKHKDEIQDLKDRRRALKESLERRAAADG